MKYETKTGLFEVIIKYKLNGLWQIINSSETIPKFLKFFSNDVGNVCTFFLRKKGTQIENIIIVEMWLNYEFLVSWFWAC